MSGPPVSLDAAVLAWLRDSAPYGVLILDGSLVVRGWNRWLEIHDGRAAVAVAGRRLADLFPDLAGRGLLGRFERALQGESSVLSTALHKHIFPFPAPGGSPGFELMRQTAHINPLRDGSGISGVVVIVEDVTQRELQAETLRWRHRRDETLSWALSRLLKTDDPRAFLRPLFFKIAEYLELDTFLLYAADGPRLRLQSYGGLSARDAKLAVDCPFEVDAAFEEPVLYDSLRDGEGPRGAGLRALGLSSAVVIPLLAAKRLIGAVCFASAARPLINPEEAEFLKLIAQHLGTAIERVETGRELRRAQSELLEYSRQLEARVEARTAELRETVAELETISYTLAHDLKAPLRGIAGYSALLLKEHASALTPEGRMLAERLQRNSQRMETLIRDLLAFSAVSREKLELEAVDLDAILEDVLSLREPEARGAVAAGSLGRAMGHAVLLEQVLANLIDNAIKFTKPGAAPRIVVSSERVERAAPNTHARDLTFSAQAAPQNPPSGGGRLRVWVADEGIGIEPELHAKIFGIFERAVAERYAGNGIGLAIVARAVQRMGGTCGVESALGEGSRFWFELPLP